MTRTATTLLLAMAALLTAGLAIAKLPTPSDEAKTKAAETAAKSAHAGKLDGYKLCLAMDKVAAGYQAGAARAGKPASAPTSTPACADPGPFVLAAAAPVTAASAASTSPPLEAAGAHSPARTAASPPSTLTPSAQQPAQK